MRTGGQVIVVSLQIYYLFHPTTKSLFLLVSIKVFSILAPRLFLCKFVIYDWGQYGRESYVISHNNAISQASALKRVFIPIQSHSLSRDI